MLVLVVVVGTLGLLTTGPHANPSVPATDRAWLTPSATPPTHGDLIVSSGQTVVISPSSGTAPYYQGGNITVLAGGTLVVENTTLSFVQYISNTGTLGQRLSHIYQFTDAGTVKFENSTLTTDVGVLNASVKLFVGITGAFSAWNSNFEFPGWIVVNGSSARATFNASTIEGNPAVTNLTGLEPQVLLGDTVSAPVLNVTNQAEVNLFGSKYLELYENNLTANGTPAAQPVTALGFALPTTGYNVTAGSFALPASVPSNLLAEDMLYPSEASNVTISLPYHSVAVSNVVAPVSVWYGGVNYPLGSVTFAPGAGTALIGAETGTPAGNALLGAMSQKGVPLDLWGGVDLASASASGVSVDSVSLGLVPLPSYNISVSGHDSTLNVVNSEIDVNWNATLLQPNAPLPWYSNKLYVTTGAAAYLANMSTSTPVLGAYATSAVETTSNGAAYLYRWAQFNLTGRGGHLPIPNSQATAFYAYNSSETANNQTANSLNDLSTASPAIWGYLQYWDKLHGLPGYGESGRAGAAYLLLAAANLTSASLPNGYALGNYHVRVFVPPPLDAGQWFSASVRPYPQGVALGMPGYQRPDYTPSVEFPGYFSSLTVGSIGLQSNGTSITPATGVAPLRTLSVDVPLINTGTALIYNLSGEMWYGSAGSIRVASIPLTNFTLEPGGTVWANFSWVVNPSITGAGGVQNQLFSMNITYNSGTSSLGGGYLNPSITLNIQRSYANLSFASITWFANGTGLPNGTVRIGQQLEALVKVNYTGTLGLDGFGAALYYTPPNLTSSHPATPIVHTNSTAHLNSVTSTGSVWLNWTVNDTVVGLQGATPFAHLFYVTIGSVYFAVNLSALDVVFIVHNTSANLLIGPSQVRLTVSTFGPSTTTINLADQYVTTGRLQYNGSQKAVVILYAVPSSGGTAVELASGTAVSGNFDLEWFPPPISLSPGNYVLSVVATYNQVSAYANSTVHYSVPSPPTSPSNFFTQSILGLPLWVWLAIAAAIVVGLVAFLLLARRQAAGKLVECGECGNLIPEDATVCPKCGAEFESDLIRCSRCASTIPANSRFCPECAAQLLGKPGEGEADPERQGYADFTEKYRAEAKRELGDNYSEGAFWDWWKRQPTYTSFSQWKLQQGTGTPRAGMTAPPAAGAVAPEVTPPGPPPKGGAGGAATAAPPPSTPSGGLAPPPTTGAGVGVPGAAAGAPLRACPNCGKEIPPEYLVCPFCGAVTQ